MSDNSSISRISVWNHISNLPVISEFVKNEMVRYQVTESKIFDVQMAVDEACTNIIHYAYPEDQEGKIEIACFMTAKNHFTVCIKDYGEPFDPTKLCESPDIDTSLEDREIGGLGVFFMKNLMDELKYEYRESDGYEELIMIKYA